VHGLCSSASVTSTLFNILLFMTGQGLFWKVNKTVSDVSSNFFNARMNLFKFIAKVLFYYLKYFISIKLKEE